MIEAAELRELTQTVARAIGSGAADQQKALLGTVRAMLADERKRTPEDAYALGALTTLQVALMQALAVPPE
jgi:hypothetical protein